MDRSEKQFLTQKHFRNIFELSPDPILIMKGPKIVDCNKAALEAMGASSRDELLNIKPEDISPKRQADGKLSSDKAKEILSKVDKVGVVRFEWMHTKIDGGDLFVEVTLTKFEEEDENIIHVHWKDLCDRLVLEEELEYSRRRFVEVSEVSSDWMWEVDTKGIYTYVSPRAKDFLGYDAQEIVGTSPFDLMPEDEAKRVADIFVDIVSEQKPFKDLENINIHKDGHEVVLSTSATPMYDMHGEFIGYRGTDRDITNIRHLIKNLQRSQENLKQAQMLANIGHWEFDLLSGGLYWSDEVYRIFGFKPQEFKATYEAFLERIHPDDRDMVNEEYTKSVENISSYQITHRILTKDMDLKYVEERCVHQLDAQGKVIRSIGTVHDITQRIEYEKQLEISAKVFEHSTDAIIITDKQNRIISINKSFEELTGYSKDEVKGKNPKILSSGWGDEKFYSDMWNDIETNGYWKGEIWDRNKSGELYAASASIVAVKDSDGEIINYIGFSHDMTESKENEKRIRQLAYYDYLTKLPNRKLFEQEVDSFIKSSHHSNEKFALLFLDLDNFKWVNDSLGHHFGDKLLVHVSNIISSIINEDSIFARLGGDEFVVLVPYNDLLTVSRLASKIIESVRHPIDLDAHEVNVGWSIGISLFPDNGSSYDMLLQNADTAMYEAKERGKNSFQYFNNSMNESAKRRLELDTRLRYAVEHQEFSLVYQPIYSCKKNRCTGFETLIRWNDSKLGFVGPDEFIPIAEQSGYIYEIGLWVLKKAFEDLQKIYSITNESSYNMAINISAKQLENKKFLIDVEKLLETNDVNPKKIVFEVTETSLMQDIENVIPVLKKIRDFGIKLSIDDFGTGYSSMAYLKKMPLNKLKIDREFIKDIGTDTEDKEIVKATLALANALNLKTVAEGVETQEHVDILMDMKCDSFQGYFFSRPIAIDELLEFLKKD
jgi:diguanylate cyclase (GGDEF)-like protein/PAS domain S-box-containing protein